MKVRPQRLTAFSGFTALGLGALGMAFERGGPSTMSADPEELAAWAARYHRELTAQSAVYVASTAPLLLFFGGLGSVLRVRQEARGAGRVDVSRAVLGGGGAWVLANLLAQALQLSMAQAASSGAPALVVASRGDRMRRMLVVGNAALTPALAATAVSAFRGALPRWLGWLSAGAAAAHLAPAASRAARQSGSGDVENLPYPVFVAWLVSIAVVLARGSTRPPSA